MCRQWPEEARAGEWRRISQGKGVNDERYLHGEWKSQFVCGVCVYKYGSAEEHLLLDLTASQLFFLS